MKGEKPPAPTRGLSSKRSAEAGAGADTGDDDEDDDVDTATAGTAAAADLIPRTDIRFALFCL